MTRKGLIKTSLRATDPVIFLMHKRLTGVRGLVGGPDDLVAFGAANVARPGEDCTIVTYGAGLAKASQAADALEASGVSAEVIDLRTLAPLDLDTVTASARKTGHVVVVDEAPKFAGPSAEIAAAVQEAAFEYLDAPVMRVAGAALPHTGRPGPIRARPAGRGRCGTRRGRDLRPLRDQAGACGLITWPRSGQGRPKGPRSARCVRPTHDVGQELVVASFGKQPCEHGGPVDVTEETALDRCHSSLGQTMGISLSLVPVRVELHRYNERRRQPPQVGGKKW